MELTYTKELMKHFRNPKYVKDIKNPDGIGKVGNIRCGDVMHLKIKVENKKGKEIIKDIGFQTFGCPAAVASSDVVCELAKGKTLDKAGKITKDDIVKKLKRMPEIKIHCSVLGVEALGEAIKDYRKKKQV
jgi:nitrogen fixation NifU-like protein